MLQTLRKLSAHEALKFQHGDRLVTVKMDLTDEASAEKTHGLMRANAKAGFSCLGVVKWLNDRAIGPAKWLGYQGWSRAEFVGNMQISATWVLHC